MAREPHSFACRLTWTGAAAGPTENYATYSRDLTVEVEGKPALLASSAPAFKGDASRYNPEDMLVAALSSCHALTYLALCTKFKIPCVGYEDQATGTMEHTGKTYKFTRVVLRPRVKVKSGADTKLAKELHERAHSECFIAQSVSFDVTHEPEIEEV